MMRFFKMRRGIAVSDHPTAIIERLEDRQLLSASFESTSPFFPDYALEVGMLMDSGSLTATTSVGLDPSFGAGGYAAFPIRLNGNTPAHVAVQADGKILVAGQSNDGLVVSRLNGDGSLDTSFGTGGIVSIAASSGHTVTALAVLPHDRIVVAGWNDFDETDPALYCFNGDGSVDTTFGNGGKTAVTFRVDAIAALPAGGILAAGAAHLNSLTLQALDAAGAPDRTVGNNGQVSFAQQYPTLAVDKLLVMPDGRITIAASFQNLADKEYFGRALIIRCNIDGSVDAAFNHGQPVSTPLSGYASRLSDAMLLDDGSLLAAGMGVDGLGPQTINLLRLTPNGAFDPTFGANGIATDAADGNFMAGPLSLSVRPSGEIVLLGFGTDDLYAGHFTPTGTLLEHQVLAEPLNGSFFTGALQTDGELVTAGYVPEYEPADPSGWVDHLTAARLHADDYTWASDMTISTPAHLIAAEDRTALQSARFQRHLKFARLKSILHSDITALHAAKKSARRAAHAKSGAVSDLAAKVMQRQTSLQGDRLALGTLRQLDFTNIAAAKSTLHGVSIAK